MQAKNIKTAHDFTLPHNEAFIRKEMGVVGMRLKYELVIITFKVTMKLFSLIPILGRLFRKN